MQIQKLGAYSAQTEKGNTYKKTNTWKTSCVLGSVLTSGLAFAKPKNVVFKEFLTTNNLKDLNIKFNPKYSKAINIAGAIVDAVIMLGLGAYIDRSINKKRAEKADKID